jgi:hypothetical protein
MLRPRIIDKFKLTETDIDKIDDYDDMKLKRTKDVLKIYTDYTKLTEKLEEIIEKENMSKFNPVEDENIENADEIFAEMEKTDQISAIWNKFQSNVKQEMQNYKVENEKIMSNG